MKKYRAKKSEMIIVGKPNNVRVVNGDVNSAIKLWKKNLKESGKLDILKEKKDYVKPSVLKRKQKTDAEYSQYLDTKRMKENNG